ncbi:MAG: LPS export ABC transporter periplasmic protein LptC, partial [Acidobacteria bacterium]|nr:LPS export ABC transporter periplasmic protein LptC [Acidobacteriota bacterium]
MTNWQRRARLAIAVFAIVFAVVVVFAFKRRTPAPAQAIVPTDPGAIVQSTGGRIERFKLSREDVSVEYEKQLSYADGSTNMIGVRIVTTERSGNRIFTVTGKEGQLGQNESTIALEGDVQLSASDGLTVRTERATYADSDGMVRATGPVEFGRDRLKGNGVGMTYDSKLDALSILDQAVVRMAPDAAGAGGFEVSSGAATFSRREHIVRFDRAMHLERGGQLVDADSGEARLTPDEKQLDSIELRGNARIAGANAAPGGLQSLTGDSMTLKYSQGGEVLQHALITGTSVLQLAGAANAAGRQITADTIDITLADDGTTPTALLAHQNVQLTFPGGRDTASRTIQAEHLDAQGQAGRGLTRAQFSGDVKYRESDGASARAANSKALDLMLRPGMDEIEEARFAGSVRFEEGLMKAIAAAARYLVGKGTLELSGVEPATRTPRVVTDRITVDAGLIDLTLAGPKMRATKGVKSELQPPKANAKSADTKLPSMLEQDQPVNVTADALDYDGTASTALYTGSAQLWQGDTSVKGASIAIDGKRGDLTAAGPVTTTTTLERLDKDKQKERVRSIASAAAFSYDEGLRRATYTGGAHVSGLQGDLTAEKIELYL